jgi:tetratricopeptide (TPR) repeat protein
LPCTSRCDLAIFFLQVPRRLPFTGTRRLLHPISAFIRSLLVLRSERRSGVLTVRSESVRTFVYLRDGVPVFAEEDSQGETLGRLLVRLGKLTQEQYVEVIRTMTDAIFDNEQLRFGEVAVARGYLDEDTVHAALVDQVRWKIVRTFQRSEVTWTFDDSLARLDDVPIVPMSLEALVLDAVRWIDPAERDALALVGKREQILRVPLETVMEIATRFALKPFEARLVAVLDGRTVGQALDTPEARAVDGRAVLTALLLTRAVATSAEAVLARPPTPTFAAPVEPVVEAIARHHSRPAVSRFGKAKEQKAAQDPKEVAPPSTPIAPPQSASRLKVTEAVAPPAPPLDEHAARMFAEAACQEGLAELRAGRYGAAADHFTRASSQMKDSIEYRLYARWCIVRARGRQAVAGARVELGALARRAMQADPNLAFAHYVAGVVALEEDRPEVARRLLERASRLDPELLDIGYQLRLVKQRLAG